jgi:hypothetical protein
MLILWWKINIEELFLGLKSKVVSFPSNFLKKKTIVQKFFYKFFLKNEAESISTGSTQKNATCTTHLWTIPLVL